MWRPAAASDKSALWSIFCLTPSIHFRLQFLYVIFFEQELFHHNEKTMRECVDEQAIPSRTGNVIQPQLLKKTSNRRTARLCVEGSQYLRIERREYNSLIDVNTPTLESRTSDSDDKVFSIPFTTPQHRAESCNHIKILPLNSFKFIDGHSVGTPPYPLPKKILLPDDF